MNRVGIISTGAKFHSYNTAIGLVRNNMLGKYIISDKKNIFKNSSENKFIKFIYLPYLVGALLRKIPLIGSRIPYNVISDILFDILALKYLKIKVNLNEISFFIGYNNYSLKQMEYMKSKKKLVILEQRIAHVNKEIEIYLEEQNRLPNNLSNTMVKRKLKEYEVADYIFVGSNYVKDTFIENDYPEEKIVVINYGYNPKHFKVIPELRANRKKGNLLKLLFVGQIGNRKGIKYLLEALEYFDNKNMEISLTLIGNIDESFKPLLNKYNSLFEYKPFMEIDDLVREYNSHDIFIFPSLCEGSARVTYEAAACGLPLIVTHSTGSIVQHMHTGLIVAEKSSLSIIDAVSILYNDRDLLETMRMNILNEVENYTWEKYQDKICEKVNELICLKNKLK